MSEGTGEKPPLTGIERVYKENLYANLRFPQTSVAVDTFTLYGLLADNDPVSLTKQFLTEPLSEECAEGMLEKATRAHNAFLTEAARPDLTTARMKMLWGNAQFSIEKVLLYVLNDDTKFRDTHSGRTDYHKQTAHILDLLERVTLPLAELRAATKAFVEAFKSPEISELLTKYRDLMSSEHIHEDSPEQREVFDQIITLQDEIKEEVFVRAWAEARKDATLNEEVLERVLHALRYRT